MEILCQNISSSPDVGAEEILQTALKRCGLKKTQVEHLSLYKQSIDARKGQVHFLSSVYLSLSDEKTAQRLCALGKAVPLAKAELPMPVKGTTVLATRPVVVGFGPAGMFCALTLARNGYRPIVLEQGAAMEERLDKVAAFWQGKPLDERTNVQFGEGGAGTFSDGKLTTRISDPYCRSVLEDFVSFGAPKEILTTAKPHIGTDRLREVVVALRKEICRLGGEVRFQTRVEGLKIENGRLVACQTEKGEIATSVCVLAPGHSARTLFRGFVNQLQMEPKNFSVGLRVEQLQSELDEGLLHQYAGKLGPASYQFSHREGNLGVYTFCMCPGGRVVSSGSAFGELVTNGMSDYARKGKNGNSALVAEVCPADFGPNLLDGIAFQEKLEHAAYQLGGGNGLAPCQSVGDFLRQPGGETGKVMPSFQPGVTMVDWNGFFPSRVEEMLKKGLQVFGRKLPCFSAPYNLLTGAETRTSSPLRILRDASLQAVGVAGVFPCGEGCGYAGGIMSAAVDGIRSAAALMALWAPAES